MKNAYILCQRFLDIDKLEEITIGGIQNYVLNLCRILVSESFKPCIIQMANRSKEVYFKDIKVIGVNVSKQNRYKAKCACLINYVKKMLLDNDLLIYSSEEMAVKNIWSNSISIQHGISWDKNKAKLSIKEMIHKLLFARLEFKYLSNVSRVVCVDYNFINWYRTIDLKRRVNFTVIPNFTAIPDDNLSKSDQISIIFARRLVEYRGTKLFTNVIKRILKSESNIKIIIAGDGPDEKWMKQELDDFPLVEFIKYNPADSLKIHKDVTIAVIPTTGSEGTSLSLLEAMASRCAVIATNVGGMTNIIIDNYNGLLVNPNCDELFDAIQKLLINKELRDNLAEKAYETAKFGFSFELWEHKWRKLLETM